MNRRLRCALAGAISRSMPIGSPTCWLCLSRSLWMDVLSAEAPAYAGITRVARELKVV